MTIPLAVVTTSLQAMIQAAPTSCVGLARVFELSFISIQGAPMKRLSLCCASLALLFLSGCSSKPLTDTECRTLSQMEIDYVMAKTPPEEAKSVRSLMASSMEGGVARCAAGKAYNRADYKCMIAASSPDQVELCLRDANSHIKR